MQKTPNNNPIRIEVLFKLLKQNPNQTGLPVSATFAIASWTLAIVRVLSGSMF